MEELGSVSKESQIYEEIVELEKEVEFLGKEICELQEKLKDILYFPDENAVQSEPLNLKLNKCSLAIRINEVKECLYSKRLEIAKITKAVDL